MCVQIEFVCIIVRTRIDTGDPSVNVRSIKMRDVFFFFLWFVKCFAISPCMLSSLILVTINIYDICKYLFINIYDLH